MELVNNKRVRTYELTYLLPESMTSTEVAQSKDAVDKLLKKHKITVVSQDDWGRKDLAYPIKYKSKKQYAAYYSHMVLEAEAVVIPAFEKDLYLQQDVIRHLIVLAQEATAVAVEEK